jgi:hypothetical protein
MKTIIKVEKEVDVKMVKMDVAVRYDEEDMPNNFPWRKGDMWSVIIDIDKGQILDWPEGVAKDIYMKVCDQGSYYLLDEQGNTVASIENDYVPHGVIPGQYGDYIDFKIQSDGTIKNWNRNISFEDFFPEDE